MQLDKGRAKPIAWNTDIPDDSLEGMMTKLGEIEAELSKRYKEYKNSVKELKKTRESLRNIIIEEVMHRKKTVTVGTIRAEYVETVVIRKKKDKEQNDGDL